MSKFPPRQIELQAPRPLTFLPPDPAFAKQIAQAIGESKGTLDAFMPWAHEEQTPGRQRARLASILGSYWEKKDMIFHVFDGSRAFVASAGLHGRVPLNPKGVEIGYWVRQQFQKQGLATTITQVLVLVACDWFGCDRVQISHNAANAASRRVIEKVGFRFEGQSRNTEAERTKEQLKAGLVACRDSCNYSLLPEDLPTLEWVKPLRELILITDVEGNQQRLS